MNITNDGGGEMDKKAAIGHIILVAVIWLAAAVAYLGASIWKSVLLVVFAAIVDVIWMAYGTAIRNRQGKSRQ